MEVAMKKLLLLTLLLFLSSVSTFATHIAGSDMEFQCLGKDTFEVTYRIYRDCGPGNAPLGNALPITLSTLDCFPSRSASTNLQRDSITPLRYLCDDKKTICEPGGTFPFGIEEHLYRGIIILSQLFPGGLDSTCCKIRVNWNSCCRNGAITNLSNPLSTGFSIDGELNRCITPCNSSPTFTNKPVAVVCNGAPFCMNMGVVDNIDRDSISYESTVPLNDNGMPVQYLPPFSPAMPLQILGPSANFPFPAGFHVDSVTGNICFTSTATQQFVMAIKVIEWRKINGVYVKIGETRRDMQLYSFQCPPNAVPKIEVNGSTIGPWTFQTCAGEALCLAIRAIDTDSAPPKLDTTRLSWNRGIPMGQFTNTNSPTLQVRWDEGQFCWTPGDQHVSSLPYYFIIKAEDDHCEVPGTTQRPIAIFVRPRPLGNRTYQKISCSKYSLNVQLTNTQNVDSTNVTYEWRVANAGNGTFNPITSTVYTTKYAEHSFTDGGYFVIRARLVAPPCTTFYFDTVYVDTPVKAIAQPDTFVCAGKSVQLSAYATNGDSPYKYKWTPAGGNDSSLQYSFLPTSKTVCVFEVTDSIGCKAYDTVNVEVKVLPKVNLGPDRRICFKDSILFDAGDNNGAGLIRFVWNSPKGSANERMIYAPDSGQYAVEVTDSFNCVNADTVLLFINKEVQAQAGPDDTLCIYETDTLRGSGGETYEWHEVSYPSVILSNQAILPLNLLQVGVKAYVLKVGVTYNGVTCYDYDTVFITTRPLPAITFSSRNVKFCLTDAWLNPGTKTGVQPVTDKATGDYGYWTISDPAKQNCFERDSTKQEFGWVKLNCLGVNQAPNPPSWKLVYVFRDRFGCINSDSVDVVILPLPVVWAGIDRVECGNKDSIAIIPYPNFGVGSEWLSPPSPNTNVPNPVLEYLPLTRKHTYYPPRAQQNHYDTLVYKATDNNGCENTDTAIIYIKPVPEVDAGKLSAVCHFDNPVDLNTAAGATPLGGIWSAEILSPPVTGLDTNGIFDPSMATRLGKGLPNILKYTFTNTYNCSTSDTVHLVVYPLPATRLTAPDSAVCENHAPVAFNGTPKGAGGVYYLNDKNLGQAQPFFEFDPNRQNNPNVLEGINWVKYHYTDVNGCKKADSLRIRVQLMPDVKLIAPLGALCEGDTFTLRGTMSKTNSFRWSTSGDGKFTGQFSNITDSTSTDSVVNYTPGANDIFNQGCFVRLISTDNGICPADVEQKPIKIEIKPSGDFTAIQEGCEPFTTFFDGAFTGYQYIRWNFGDQTSPLVGDEDPVHTYVKKGLYDVSVYLRSPAGCEQTITKTQFIKVNPTPVAYFEPDKKKSTIALPRFTFFNKSTNYTDKDSVTLLWDFGDPKSDVDTSGTNNPTYTYEPSIGKYIVTLNVTTNKGCTSEYSDTLLLEPDITVFAPNAFRPQSAQDRNQKFYIVVDGAMTYHLDIFNRWGELVFSSDDPEEGWDGRYQNINSQQDVYVWQVNVTSYSGRPYKYSGTVTLIR
jgi:hypothetical protein